MPTYAIITKNVDKTAHHLESIGERANKAAPAFEKISEELLLNEQGIWKRNGGGGAGKWPANTKSTLATKIARHLDTRPMRATGALERSLTIKGAPGQIRWWNTRQMQFGTSIWYAHFSQDNKNPERKRVVLKILPKARKNIREIILEHLIEGP